MTQQHQVFFLDSLHVRPPSIYPIQFNSNQILIQIFSVEFL